LQKRGRCAIAAIIFGEIDGRDVVRRAFRTESDAGEAANLQNQIPGEMAEWQ
jgi:hypothetical protein